MILAAAHLANLRKGTTLLEDLSRMLDIQGAGAVLQPLRLRREELPVQRALFRRRALANWADAATLHQDLGICLGHALCLQVRATLLALDAVLRAGRSHTAVSGCQLPRREGSRPLVQFVLYLGVACKVSAPLTLLPRGRRHRNGPRALRRRRLMVSLLQLLMLRALLHRQLLL